MARMVGTTQFREILGKHSLQKGVRLRVQSGSVQRYVFLQTKK